VDPLKRLQTNDNALRVMLAWEELRKLDREIPGQVVSMFFYIASHNPCHKQAIEEDLEFTVASASRNLQWLTDTNRLGKPGLGLIEKYTEEGSRRIVCRLSHKGKQFVDNFLSVIYD
jgi:DNA-binding MarR family transcriptional regulator